MAVTEQPVKYAASDGMKFDTRGEAERHDALVVAQREYDSALDALLQAMAETHKTADGYLFDWRRWTYYYLSENFLNPAVFRVTLSMPRINLLDSGGVELVTEYWTDKPVRYRLDRLYQTETAANAALLVEKERILSSVQEDVDELRRKINGED